MAVTLSLPATSSSATPSAGGLTSIGVGIDTARYGHRAVFMTADRQSAAPDLAFAESRVGYDQLARVIERLRTRHPQAHFQIRLDAAGNYAVNLEAFLRSLNVPKTVSVGEPCRNQRYRQAHYPKRKSDATDAQACARFAVVEQPPATAETPLVFHRLRELVSRLESQTRHTTRAVNQLHNTLSRVFPELAMATPNLAAGYVLRLLAAYPSAQRIAAARLESLRKIPGMRAARAEQLHRDAAHTIGVWQDDFTEQAIAQLVRQIQQSQKAEREWKRLILQAFDALPAGGHQQLATIPGIGQLGAAVLTAKIVTIDRFERPEQLVSYFGVFPQECSSGVDRHGRPHAPGSMVMSAQGNDLVRKFLWMSAKCACRHNPAVRPLFARLKSRGASSATAWGHGMRKLLHLAFAVWKTNQPFDPGHYAWDQPRAPKSEAVEGVVPPTVIEASATLAVTPSVPPIPVEVQAAVAAATTVAEGDARVALEKTDAAEKTPRATWSKAPQSKWSPRLHPA